MTAKTQSKTQEIATALDLAVGEDPTTPANDQARCRHCGKWLLKESSVEIEQGDYCAHIREQGWDDATLMKHRLSMTKDEVPENYIKVTGQLNPICRKNGVPVGRMVTAIGGDRCLEGVSPVDPRLTPIYSGRNRWVSPWAATPEGLARIIGVKPLRNMDKLDKKVLSAWEKMYG